MLIPILQIASSVALIALVLLQERSAGLSGIFGGESGGFYQTRRGLERVIFWMTIVVAIAFAGLAISALFLR